MFISDLNEEIMTLYPEVFLDQAHREKGVRSRLLPFTPPVPLGKRLLRQLASARRNQSETSWMSHDWFKFLLGCTAGVCVSMTIMLFYRVRSINDVRDVNIVFLSMVFGCSLTALIFKMCRI